MSAAIEHHYQRLEFLGDAVLEFLATHHIFCLMPDSDEGALTDYRTGVITNKELAAWYARSGVACPRVAPPGRTLRVTLMLVR